MYCVHGVPVVKHAQITKSVQLRLTGDLIQLTSSQLDTDFLFQHYIVLRECGNAGMQHLKKPILDLKLLYVEQIE